MRILSEQLWSELRFALRRLRAAPVFAAFAVISLALGLGVTTAVYSTVGSLWRAPTLYDATHLIVMTARQPNQPSHWREAVSAADFDVLRGSMRTVSQLSASSVITADLNDGNQTTGIVGEAVSAEYFATLHLSAVLGRSLVAADDRPDADPVVVLSHDFWQRRTGGDPAIVGRPVRMNGVPFVVVGVAAEGVAGLRMLDRVVGISDDLWIPLAARHLVAGAPEDSRAGILTVFARPAARTSLPVVAAEIGAIGAALDRSEGTATRGWSASTAAAIVKAEATAPREMGLIIVVLVGLVLVIACTNIANLTLGRGASRQHELAVRRALGASRGRLIREQCVESALLAGTGGFGAILVAQALVVRLTTDLPTGTLHRIAVRPQLDGWALVLAAGSMITALLMFGLIPAAQLTRAALNARLAGGGGSFTDARWRGRRHLIVWQVAMSTALLLIAAASTSALVADLRHDPGFALQQLAIGSVSLPAADDDTDQPGQTIEELNAAVHARPGFVAAALASGLPMGPGRSLRFAAVSRGDGGASRSAVSLPSTPGIFNTLNVPIVRGRAFDDRDGQDTDPVIVLSDRVARDLFDSSDVVGRSVDYQSGDSDPETLMVIGIARDTDSVRLFERRMGTVYVPLAQHPARRVMLVGRTAGNPAVMAASFAGIVRQVNPDLAVEFAGSGLDTMTPGAVVLRALSTFSGGLSMVAIMMAMVGLYGVLSHLVARRTREIGIRLALGAGRGEVSRMIVREGLHPVAWGLGAGVIAGVVSRVALAKLMVGGGVSAIDVPAFGVAAAVMLTTGLMATYLPARRAARTEPTVALRDV